MNCLSLSPFEKNPRGCLPLSYFTPTHMRVASVIGASRAFLDGYVVVIGLIMFSLHFIKASSVSGVHAIGELFFSRKY